MTNKASLHVTQPGNLNGLGEWLYDTDDVGSPAPVLYSVNGNLKNTLIENSPTTKLIYRRQTETFNRLPNNFFNDDPVISATNWITGTRDSADQNRTLLENWRLNPADWYDPLNEPVLQLPPNYTDAQLQEEIRKAKYLNTWMVTALNIAQANGVKLALFSFPTGGPSMELWPYLYPALRQGQAQGAILSLHEYSIEGSLQHGQPGNVLRYRSVYASLPADCRLPIVISECGAGNGYDTGLSGQAWVDDLMWYNGECCQDSYLLGFCAYQLGGNESNLVSTLPAYSAAINNFTCSTQPPDPIPPANTSASGDFASRSSLVDAHGATWRLDFQTLRNASGYPVLKNDTHFAGGRGVSLWFNNGKMYVTNLPGLWYEITDTGYVALPNSPLPVYVPPTPNTEPFWVGWPIKSSEAPRITDKFNAPRDYANHKHEGLDCDGYDNSTGQNATVVAAQDGVVEYIVNRSGTGYGLHVVIKHPWGNEPSRYRTLYAHLSQTTVSIGQSIKRGDKIGVAGATGTSAVHLHFNVHDTAGLKGYVRESDCSGNWPDGVIDPESVLRYDNTPPNPTPTTVKFGLGYGTQNEITQQNADFYGSIWGVDVQASFKFLTLPDGGAMTRSIQKIKAKNPNGLCARIFFSAGNTPFTPQNFVDYSSNGTIAAYGQGILDFEVHNEPNLAAEAAGTWTNGTGFGNWLKNTIPLLRSRYPNAHFWFPGLSPNDSAPRFIEEALMVAGLSSLLYGYCFHSYWYTESGGQWNMNDETGGLSWKKLWRALPPSEQSKPIWISEFSNNNPSVAPNVKGQQYKRYRSLLSQNGVSIASSFVLFWSDDPNKENWVNSSNGSTGIKEGFLA